MIKNIIKKILKEELDLTKPVVVFVGGADGDGQGEVVWCGAGDVRMVLLGVNFTSKIIEKHSR